MTCSGQAKFESYLPQRQALSSAVLEAVCQILSHVENLWKAVNDSV